jgi:hypothetical protein
MSLLVVALAVPLAMAGSEKAATEKVEAQAEELPPGMTAEDMAKWQQATSPGPEHARLAEMAGSYTFDGTFWMAPDAPPMTITGTAERTMDFDGRVLVEKVKSEWQGEAFEGLSMTGYDNVAKAYWGSWVDNMSTGMMTSAGTCSEDSCEFTGTFHDPMTGEPKTVRMTMTHADGKEIHASYEPGPDGKEFKSMELVYTRAE